MDVPVKMSNNSKSCDNNQLNSVGDSEETDAAKLNKIINKNENCNHLKEIVPATSETFVKSENHNNANADDQFELNATDEMKVQYHTTASTSGENDNNLELFINDVNNDSEMVADNDDVKADDIFSQMDERTQSSTKSSPERGLIPANMPPTDESPLQEEKSINTGENPSNIDVKSVERMTPEKALNLLPNNCVIAQPINVIRNGTIPNAGKPQLSTMSKKLEQFTKSGRTRKPKSSVAMYESELSKHKPGIKLCIKKAETTFNTTPSTASTVSTVVNTINKSSSLSCSKSRKGSKQLKQRARIQDNTDELDKFDYEPKRKKERGNKKLTHMTSGLAGTAVEEGTEPIEQSAWGSRLPIEILFKIFEILVESEGSLPILCRLGRVCSLWRRASLTPGLWKSMDLSTWMKEKYRSEYKLKWFIENRCANCIELNVSNWKVTDINCFLYKLMDSAPNLASISIAGWKGFTSDHLSFLVKNMKNLQKLDLSSINVEMNASKSAVGVQSLCNALQTMNERLTHIYLAHNRLAGIPLIVNVLSSFCPNLLLLDLSNITTQATSHGVLHIDKLQQGCPKLKVLRITNSHITLSSLQETDDSPGFPDLEELSVAALADESRVLGDEHLQRILKSSSKLKLLDVRCCSRLTHKSLIRLPAWDIKHLFLSGCSITRDMGSGLELIASKWAHSLIELDLAWANVQEPLDNALHALAEKGPESRLAHLNLCGSSVSENAVKEILANCPLMSSINLSSCRGLPRGVKRLMQGPQELNELREVLKVQLKVKIPDPTNLSNTLQQNPTIVTTATTTSITTITTSITSTAVANFNNSNDSSQDGGDIHFNNSP